jgi:uncharacterized protein (TIGR02147 family)
MKSVYDYVNFRDFLHEHLASRKKENRRLSLRSIAYRIGCDPGLFSKVLKGTRSLSAESALKLADVLRLGRKERLYFETLVKFNQARSQIERNYLFEQLIKCKKAAIKTMPPQQHAMYEHWYYVALRDALNLMQCRDGSDEDIKKAARLLMPSVKTEEVRKAVELLKRLELVLADKKGILRAAENFITSGPEVPQVIANQYLIECMELARQAIDTIPREERNLSTLTFSVSPQGYERIKKKIEETRQEILSLVDNDDGAVDRVYHCNFHFFPVTKKIDKGEIER